MLTMVGVRVRVGEVRALADVSIKFGNPLVAELNTTFENLVSVLPSVDIDQKYRVGNVVDKMVECIMEARKVNSDMEEAVWYVGKDEVNVYTRDYLDAEADNVCIQCNPIE